jgi:hypothetical protein
MAKNQVLVQASPKLTVNLRKLWGPPPIAACDNPDLYWQFAAAIVADLQPADMIEWTYVKEIVEYTWEARELRSHKAQLTRVAEERAQAAASPARRKKNEEHFATPQGRTQLFLGMLEEFRIIDELIAKAEGRRTERLRDLANYRERASRVRKKSPDERIVEGEFTEPEPRALTATPETAPKPSNDAGSPRDAA